mgnify:CR=1 FL=1
MGICIVKYRLGILRGSKGRDGRSELVQSKSKERRQWGYRCRDENRTATITPRSKKISTVALSARTGKVDRTPELTKYLARKASERTVGGNIKFSFGQNTDRNEMDSKSNNPYGNISITSEHRKNRLGGGQDSAIKQAIKNDIMKINQILGRRAGGNKDRKYSHLDTERLVTTPAWNLTHQHCASALPKSGLFIETSNPGEEFFEQTTPIKKPLSSIPDPTEREDSISKLSPIPASKDPIHSDLFHSASIPSIPPLISIIPPEEERGERAGLHRSKTIQTAMARGCPPPGDGQGLEGGEGPSLSTPPLPRPVQPNTGSTYKRISFHKVI